jgi:hypothetical protein
MDGENCIPDLGYTSVIGVGRKVLQHTTIDMCTRNRLYTIMCEGSEMHKNLPLITARASIETEA